MCSSRLQSNLQTLASVTSKSLRAQLCGILAARKTEESASPSTSPGERFMASGLPGPKPGPHASGNVQDMKMSAWCKKNASAVSRILRLRRATLPTVSLHRFTVLRLRFRIGRRRVPETENAKSISLLGSTWHLKVVGECL